MIRGEELTEDDFDDLDEAAQLKDISHMPRASSVPSSPGARSTVYSARNLLVYQLMPGAAP